MFRCESKKFLTMALVQRETGESTMFLLKITGPRAISATSHVPCLDHHNVANLPLQARDAVWIKFLAKRYLGISSGGTAFQTFGLDPLMFLSEI
jgi:hypothetical protein